MSEPREDRLAPDAPCPVAHPASSPPAEVAGTDPRIDDYLDHVYAPLVGRVDYAERSALRAELKAHLDALVEASCEVGTHPDAAVVAALAQFGPPRILSREWLCACERLQRPGGALSARPATRAALGWLGLASGFFYALALWTIVTHNYPPLLWNPVTLFSIPILAGLATGWTAPNRAALGVFYALAGIVGVVGMGLGLLPDGGVRDPTGELAGFCMVQAIFWLPVGCATSALGGWLRRLRAAAPRQWTFPA